MLRTTSFLGLIAIGLVLQAPLTRLPEPFATPWFRKPTRVVAMPDGHQLTVPAGFTVSIFADKLQMARFMAIAPNGDVFLSEPVSSRAGKITILRDADHDGIAETRETFATGLNRPGTSPRALMTSNACTIPTISSSVSWYTGTRLYADCAI